VLLSPLKPDVSLKEVYMFISSSRKHSQCHSYGLELVNIIGNIITVYFEKHTKQISRMRGNKIVSVFKQVTIYVP